MKHLLVALLISLIFALGAMGAGRVAAADLQDASGLYPGSVQVIAEHINLRAARQGRVSETGTYQTADAFSAVLTWYSGRYKPEPGQHKPNQCVILKRADSYIAFHQTVTVTLCPLTHGTQIIFNRNYYLGS
jgi:hypothetical protein